MNLAEAERAILINQFENLKRLDPDSPEGYDERIEILQSGYSVFYDEVVPWILEEMSEDDSELVFETLNMYRAFEAFYRDHPDSSLLARYGARFDGFDGNEEPSHHGFAQFLIKTQGKYQEQLENPKFALNSHSPRVARYTRMVAAWNELHQKWDITEADIDRILGAE